MQRADERGPSDQTVGERSALVRTIGLRREGVTLATVEDGDAMNAGEERAPLPFGNLRKKPEPNVFGHGAHPTTGKERTNWFAVAGSSRSSHGSYVAAEDASIAASSSAARPSLSSTTIARMRAIPTRSTKA